MLEYLSDVFPVLNWIIRVDQNVIKINDDAMINEDVVHELLKRHW